MNTFKLNCYVLMACFPCLKTSKSNLAFGRWSFKHEWNFQADPQWPECWLAALIDTEYQVNTLKSYLVFDISTFKIKQNLNLLILMNCFLIACDCLRFLFVCFLINLCCHRTKRQETQDSRLVLKLNCETSHSYKDWKDEMTKKNPYIFCPSALTIHWMWTS